MATQRLMSEDEVLRYFIVNGGLVRNNEIVTHFRNYLANPAIRDEARALFKVIVNKLATVKVENGEKFLVLKRQYFHPIDGNGNPSPPVLSPPSHQVQYQSPGQLHDSAPITTSNFTPFPFQAPPPYVRAYDQIPQQSDMLLPMSPPPAPSFIHDTPRPQPPPNNFHHHHKSQSQISLNTSADFTSPVYHPHGEGTRKSISSVSRAEYEYGLPPPPKQNPPRRLSFGSPSIQAPIGPPIGSPRQIIPPPYRPPPPVMSPTTPPRPVPGNLNFQSPTFQQNFTSPPPQYRRTQSVSGLRTSSSSSTPGVVAGFQTANPAGSIDPSKDQSPISPFIQNHTSTVPPPPVPPRAKRSSSFVDRRIPMEEGPRSGDEKENQKPSIGPGVTGTDSVDTVEGDKDEGQENEGSAQGDGIISVRERMQKFNAANTDLDLSPPKPSNGPGKKEGQKENGDYDTSSLSSFSYGYVPEPKAREWILKAAKTDYAGINKMAQEMPSLVRRKDMNGYTALHWAAKHGHVELVKLLAGTYKSNVNAKSNGGYTPLHLAAQFSRQEVYDILIKVYNADANLRDHGGKKPMQYFVRQDTSVSAQTVKKLKDKRRSVLEGGKDKDRESQFGNAFLRIGSLNVRVKKTTEAFGHFLGKSSSTSHVERMIQKKWGSAESLPEADIEKGLMPPPSRNSVVKSGGSSKSRKMKNRKSLQIPFPAAPLPQSTSPRPESKVSEMAMSEERSGSDSDNACGFGSGWKQAT